MLAPLCYQLANTNPYHSNHPDTDMNLCRQHSTNGQVGIPNCERKSVKKNCVRQVDDSKYFFISASTVLALMPLNNRMASFARHLVHAVHSPAGKSHVGAHLGTNMAAGNQQKHPSLSFATKGEIYLSRNSKTIKIRLFPIQELFR